MRRLRYFAAIAADYAFFPALMAAGWYVWAGTP